MTLIQLLGVRLSYIEDSQKLSDPVRPGEQWFLYWKTSPALWESRILQTPPFETIFIPIYWGFHGEGQNSWDFGKNMPERDLLRLAQTLTQHNRKFCWILPLTPAPFFPNGGTPVFASRTLSVSRDGVHLAAFDQEKKLNKLYSFFEPKVFSAYNQFLEAFAQFLAQNKLRSSVWGAEFFYLENQNNVSYFEDQSLAFEQGFSRYLKKSHPEGIELTEARTEALLKDTFTHEVKALFQTTAETCLAPFWKGIQKIVCMGGSPRDTILRSLPGGKSQLEYTKDLFHHFIHRETISSALLWPEEKRETLDWIFQEHFGAKEIDRRYKDHVDRGELGEEWRSFGVVEIYGGRRESEFFESGLMSFLESHFRWLYQSLDELTFTPEWIDANHHKIKVFHGTDLNRTTFGQILKLFLMGQRILLDKSGMSPELEKRLQIFLLENDLKTQLVNFMTQTQVCELGEGRLILFEGDKLRTNPEKLRFWQNIFRYLNLIQPEMKMDQDVFSVWRIRATTPHELSYLDVRRVNIYNPTSYKKIVSIRTNKHFAFMKMIDPTRAVAKSTPEGVEVELLPKGKIALDFGHYEEN
jgi:hypothetical protein